MEIKSILVIVLILLIGLGIGASFTGLASVGGPSGGGEWICSIPDYNTCEQYIPKSEWISQNCVTNEESQVVCPVNQDGQTIGVLLSELESQGLMTDQMCSEYACALEIWGRVLVQPTA
jgi:hypothetical protein